MRSRGHHAPGDQYADTGQVADYPANAAGIGKPERKAALKQDDGDSHGNEWKQQFPEEVVRVQYAGCRAQHQASQQQQQYGWQAHSPGCPLAKDPQHQQQGNL